MNQIDDILFADASFPVTVNADRASIIDDIDTASHAMHEAIEIKYFYKGKSTLLIGNKTVNAEAGDIIIINPYEIHATVDYPKEEKGEYCLIMVGLDLFGGLSGVDFNLRHMLLSDQKAFKTHIKGNESMQKLLSELAFEYSQKLAESRLAVAGILARFFALLVREGMETKSAAASSDSFRYYKAVEPAIRMIRDSYSSSFTIDALADACNMSKFHFCRIFKAVTGASTIQYVNSYRLKIADALLVNTNMRTSEIATQCGFEDASYFCKIYRRHYGKTPRARKPDKTK